MRPSSPGDFRLLNVDYKDASKVIATTIENDVEEQTKIQNISGIFVQLDFCKAYDTIERNSVKKWIWTFYFNMKCFS